MFLFNKIKNKKIAIIEIASSSVGGILFEQDEKGKPRILSMNREPVNFLLDIDFNAFWRCTLNSLKKTIAKLLKDYPSGPDKCLCVFLSPWFTPYSKAVKIERDNPFEITKKFFEEITKNEEENFKRQWLIKKQEEFGVPEFIEHDILKVELNGYYTNQPLHKKARVVKTYFYMSLGIKKIMKEIEFLVFKNFGDIILNFKTFPPIAFWFLKNKINTNEGFLLVDTSGEITDITFFRKNNIEEIISFTKGKNILLRKIAAYFNIFPSGAEALLETYIRGHINEKEKGKISLIIEEAKTEWKKSFLNALKQVFKHRPLPTNIFFIGDDIVGRQFLNCAETEEFAGFTILGKPFEVKNILFESLINDVVFNLKSPTEKGDIFLLIESVFANKNL